jgi:chromate reductase, NAD(P)H dehydrogenase (quinone)
MKIVGISGSLRARSSNAALLRAAAAVVPDGATVAIYDRMAELPHFNPDLDTEASEPPPAVRMLRETLIAAEGVLISSPEYAHGAPGALKNLLDWLVSTGELAGKPVALLNASPSGGSYAQAALLETLRTMDWRVVEEASLIEPFVTRRIDGELVDEEALATLRRALETFVLHLGVRRP